MHKYDQSKGMSDQKKISLETGVNVYFAYLQSQKQRGNNEYTNGLLRQYFPKGTDLSGYSQEQLDELAWEPKTPTREIMVVMSPAEIFT